MLLENCKTLRQPPNGEDGFFVPPPKVQILPEVIDRLGLLKSDTIKTVTSAYLVNRSIQERIADPRSANAK